MNRNHRKQLREATAKAEKAAQDKFINDTLNPPTAADRILAGIEFRTKGGRELVASRLNLELNQSANAILKGQHQYRDEREKQFYSRIEKLEEALRLEQRRHFEDIQNFAGGSMSVVAGERRY